MPALNLRFNVHFRLWKQQLGKQSDYKVRLLLINVPKLSFQPLP